VNGLNIFLERGMLEWMLFFENPKISYRSRPAMNSIGNRNEIVAILSNIMEDGRFGA
jgi:hypothetical protein